jgi:hypothetical protein
MELNSRVKRLNPNYLARKGTREEKTKVQSPNKRPTPQSAGPTMGKP